jgi:hypothetical protein
MASAHRVRYPDRVSKRAEKLAKVGVWSAWSCVLAMAVATACGSEDGKRTTPRDYDAAGSPGSAGDGGRTAGGDATSEAGASGSTDAGASGGSSPSDGGEGGTSSGGTATTAAGAPTEMAGAAGSAGAAGAGPDCTGVDPESLAGAWTTNCNGYSCWITFTAAGDMSGACTNGQYESGTVDEAGNLVTTGEGGPYPAYSTEGPLTRTSCDGLKRDYIGQIPPFTGPEMNYSCEMTRVEACAPTLLEAFAGTWTTSCGGSTCDTTFTLEGEMSTTCSNGQGSSGNLSETGAFSDEGGGGSFDDYSTTGVVGLTSCDSFIMPYTYQTPPHQGTKHSQQCVYSRKP